MRPITCITCGYHGNTVEAPHCWTCNADLRARSGGRWFAGDLFALAVVAWMIVAAPMSIQPNTAQAGTAAISAQRDACARSMALVSQAWDAYRAKRYRSGVEYAQAANRQAQEACGSVTVQHAMLGLALSAQAWNEHFTSMDASIADMNSAMDQLDHCVDDKGLSAKLLVRCEAQEQRNYDAAARWDAENPTSV